MLPEITTIVGREPASATVRAASPPTGLGCGQTIMIAVSCASTWKPIFMRNRMSPARELSPRILIDLTANSLCRCGLEATANRPQVGPNPEGGRLSLSPGPPLEAYSRRPEYRPCGCGFLALSQQPQAVEGHRMTLEGIGINSPCPSRLECPESRLLSLRQQPASRLR